MCTKTGHLHRYVVFLQKLIKFNESALKRIEGTMALFQARRSCKGTHPSGPRRGDGNAEQAVRGRLFEPEWWRKINSSAQLMAAVLIASGHSTRMLCAVYVIFRMLILIALNQSNRN